MIPPRPLTRQGLYAYFVLFVITARSALAALQNVTVDDAVLTGAVVPQYLPSTSDWNVGNNCTVCLVKPDPTLAYNGTWHDATYVPNTTDAQAIEFTFTGTGLYIFFILANNVTSATTFTNVQFVLDGIVVSTYLHTPGTTDVYQYNVPVYANGSLQGSGQHTMMIQPVNSGNHVLILFDYLIYTTNTSSSVTSSASPTSTSSTSETQGTSSGQNIGAIVGGAVGGVTALVIVVASLVCYWRRRRRNASWASAEEAPVVEPFFESVGMAPTSLVSVTPLSTFRTASPYAESASKPAPSNVTLPLSIPSTTTAPTSVGASSSVNVGLLEQVGLLRDEVARLRDLHEVPPPEYSTGRGAE